MKGVQHIAEFKCKENVAVLFARSIGANFLVCMGVFFAMSAEDVPGKILGCFLPVLIAP